MTQLVLDASILVDSLVDRSRKQRFAEAVADARLVAPAHVKAEALSAVGRIHRAGDFSRRRATAAVTAIQSLPIEQVPLDLVLLDAWELRNNIRLTDALYVALARQRKATLLTVDERLVAAAPDVARHP